MINPPSGVSDEKTSLLKDWQEHWQTILTATVLLAGIAYIHVHSNPHLMFLLFYAIPSALLALVVSTRWATPVCAMASSVIAPLVQYDDGDSPASAPNRA